MLRQSYTRRNISPGVFIIFLLLLILPCPNRLPAADWSPSIEGRIQTTTDPVTQAKRYKELGDRKISEDRIGEAADAFAKALSLARDQFSPAERIRMAIYLSWADRLHDSAEELKWILAADPKNVAARSHLARVLSWSGELHEAIDQADVVLKESPGHKDTLLVKADALQWQGDYKAARPIYEKLLGSEVDFDARIGLAYAHLGSGNRLAALEIAELLKPANSRQKSARDKVIDAIDRETRPRLDVRYNYYSDSDGNRLNRYALLYRFWAGNIDWGMSLRHTNARDDRRSNRAEDLLLTAYTHVTDSIGIGAGLGVGQFHDGHASNFPTGRFKIDGKLFSGTLGATVTREIVSDTAELVKNRIRLTSLGLYLSQPISERFSLNGGYAYKDFSDGNHANDLQLVSQYVLHLNPKIAIGDRFRLLDFAGQSHSGYFDPNNYVANRVFTSVYLERAMFYTYLEGFVGYQTFRRDGIASDDFIKGGSGSVGIKPLANLSIEINAEGGNFAAGSASGFSYFIVGPRLLLRF